jgi:NAD(P)-dependent dehydrogenase (short-subunit alcohol dehydrogenase family)
MRNVLITGTSTGIGRATAVVLASRGWRVFATMRNLQKRSLLEQALGKAGVRKWALEGWAESIAFELEPFGIDIILVEAGPYRTEIWSSTPRIQPLGSPYHQWVRHLFRAGMLIPPG